ncbi:WG repeat-containing protein [Flavitalea antarctica]
MKLILLAGVMLIIISACIMAFKKPGSRLNEPTMDIGAVKHSTDLHEYAGILYPVKRNGKWGYMNNKLEFIITAKFANAGDFNEGLAAVSNLVDEGTGSLKEYYGFIDSTGKLVVEFRYDRVLDFSEGFAVVVEHGKYGYINKDGVELIKPQYEDAASFSEGLAAVKINDKNGFINTDGRMVIGPRYARACWVSAFSEGLAPVYFEDDAAGYIDREGKLIIPADYLYVSAFSEGLALVQPKGKTKYGYINKKGEIVIEPIYELSLPFSEGVASVKLSRPDGSTFFRVLNKDGRTIADNLNYSFTGIFREGLAGVETNDYRWGFIDKYGTEVIPPKYASVRLFRNGLSMIQTGSLFTTLNTGYIDKAGNVVVAPEK